MIDILRLSISVSMYLFRSNKFGLNIYLLTSSYLPTAATITHIVLNNSVKCSSKLFYYVNETIDTNYMP